MLHETKAARIYLSQIATLNARVEASKKALRMLRASQSYISGISYDRERVQTSPSNSASYEDQVIRMVENERTYEADIVAAENARQEIIGTIRKMSTPVYMSIIWARYVDGKRIQEVAEDMCLTEGWVRQQGAEAIAEYYDANRVTIEAYLAKRSAPGAFINFSA